MKYLITESKLESYIEKFIKDYFSDVVYVKFKKVKVHLASDDKTIDSTRIQILIDPEGILNGNFNPNKGHWVGDDLKRNIWQTVNSMFGLQMEKYGSEWDIEFKVLSTY